MPIPPRPSSCSIVYWPRRASASGDSSEEVRWVAGRGWRVEGSAAVPYPPPTPVTTAPPPSTRHPPPRSSGVRRLWSLCGRLRHPFVSGLFHLLGREVLHASGESPLVAVGVGDLAEAVAPEGVLEGVADLRAGAESAIEGGVDIVDVDVEGARDPLGAQRREGPPLW